MLVITLQMVGTVCCIVGFGALATVRDNLVPALTGLGIGVTTGLFFFAMARIIELLQQIASHQQQ